MKKTLEISDLEDDDRLGVGFWHDNFGTVDMYFKNDIPLKDIDTSDLYKQQIQDLAKRTIDRLFLMIEKASK